MVKLTEIVRYAIWWAGSLAVAYVLFISGIHKFTYKIKDIELSEEMYTRIDKFYLLAADHFHKEVVELFHTHLPNTRPPAKFSAQTWKRVIGGFQLILVLLWFSKKHWRKAAWGSVLVMAAWLAVAETGLMEYKGDSFATVFFAISVLMLTIGPKKPSLAQLLKKQKSK